MSLSPRSRAGPAKPFRFLRTSHATGSPSSARAASPAPRASAAARSSCLVSVVISERRAVRTRPWKRGPWRGCLRKSSMALTASLGSRLRPRRDQAGLAKLRRPAAARPRQSTRAASQKKVPGGISQMWEWFASWTSTSPATTTKRRSTKFLVMTNTSPDGVQRRFCQSLRTTSIWHSTGKVGMKRIFGTIKAMSDTEAHAVTSSETWAPMAAKVKPACGPQRQQRTRLASKLPGRPTS
mmetsp:Transcript_109806/g.321536  ORF Transcript_109806/g.321536 Transcript_109806/m.321536 type:complete len:239 (+) Transcript_109806:201-917(+)